MIDRDPQKNKKGTLPEFTPVPRLCQRHDGWTAERQRGFVEALADLGSVRAAAHAVNMTPESAYQLRRHPEAHEFRKAWEAALRCGIQRLEDIAMDRALHGVAVPIFHNGEQVGEHRRYNDRLLMFLLRNRAPKRFAADSWHKGDAATQSKVKRLRAEWQKEWEAEQNDPARIEEIRASIERKTEEMRQRVLRRRQEEFDQASEKTRELYLAWQKSNEADKQARERARLPAPLREARRRKSEEDQTGQEE